MKRFAIPGRSRIETGEDYALSELMQHKASGLRERNKLDKFRRIKEAASELFIRKGYDDTTTREIACAPARGSPYSSGPGTARSLFQIVNDDCRMSTGRRFGVARTTDVGQPVAIFNGITAISRRNRSDWSCAR
jgi:hypothetical protein